MLVRPVKGLSEMQQLASLRAEAYHEARLRLHGAGKVGAGCSVWCGEQCAYPYHRSCGRSVLMLGPVLQGNNSRFVGSLKRQFSDQEVESLRIRTTPVGGGAPAVECLVSDSWAEGVVVVHPPTTAPTAHYPRPAPLLSRAPRTRAYCPMKPPNRSLHPWLLHHLHRLLAHISAADVLGRTWARPQVALEDSEGGSVLGCIDTRLPRTTCGVQPQVSVPDTWHLM